MNDIVKITPRSTDTPTIKPTVIWEDSPSQITNIIPYTILLAVGLVSSYFDFHWTWIPVVLAGVALIV